MENKEVVRRLDAMISLLLRLANARGEMTDQDRIQQLDSCGLAPGEIARILGKTSDQVSKQIYVIRQKEKRHTIKNRSK